jgi:Holliday junction resolvase RusA-like endonuclease
MGGVSDVETYPAGTTLVDFVARGRPRTKGSMTFTCGRDRAHTPRVYETGKFSKPWRATMARACRADQMSRHGRLLSYRGAVEVRALFVYEREPVPSHDGPWPTVIHLGDLDKLLRNAGDAMARPANRAAAEYAAGLLADDSVIVDIRARKMWGTAAGVRIAVRVAPDAPTGDLFA